VLLGLIPERSWWARDIIPAAITGNHHTLTVFLLTSSIASVLSVILGFSIRPLYPHLIIARH
jgi:hypothetical protein